MNRYIQSEHLLSQLTLFLSCFLGAGTVYGQDTKKPNFIMILADDMGWADLGADGSGIDTPHLDQMAKEGIKFSHFYASATMCSPTRAALLTGCYQHSVGVPELCSPTERGDVPVLHLSLDATTIPEALKPQGYKSMIAGKWHLGFDQAYWPRQHGFDLFWGSLLGTPGYYDVQEAYYNETPIEVDGYFTDRITDKAVRFIQENQNTPFFLYLAYNAPHYPLEAPTELIEKYNQKFEDEEFSIYAAMVEQMDAGIGRIFNKLKQLGLDDNTFVFFTSDNGPSPEPKAYKLKGAKKSAGPLREHKFSTFEGGIRVPAIGWWPGQIPAGAASGRVASIMDIFPTYLDILDNTADIDFHGKSLLPLLHGEDVQIHKSLHWEDQRMWAVQKDNWKLVGRFWEPKPKLFDLSKDIGEQMNIASKHPAVVDELISIHKNWQKKIYPNPLPRHTHERPKYHFPQN